MVIGFFVFFSQELGYEQGQSVTLLEKFFTVPAVLAACSDVAKGKNYIYFFHIN